MRSQSAAETLKSSFQSSSIGYQSDERPQPIPTRTACPSSCRSDVRLRARPHSVCLQRCSTGLQRALMRGISRASSRQRLLPIKPRLARNLAGGKGAKSQDAAAMRRLPILVHGCRRSGRIAGVWSATLLCVLVICHRLFRPRSVCVLGILRCAACCTCTASSNSATCLRQCVSCKKRGHQSD